MPRDPVRSARIDQDTWDTLLKTSITMGVSVSEVLRLAIRGLLEDTKDAA